MGKWLGKSVDLLERKHKQWALDHPGQRMPGLWPLLPDHGDLGQIVLDLYESPGAYTPGIDRLTIIEWDKNPDNIINLIAQLDAGTFQPSPVLFSTVPKGHGKVRPIGIPTITDRVVQIRLKQMMEGLFEADFLDCSHGYRSGRSPQTAEPVVLAALKTGQYHYVVEGDITNCFGSLDHDIVLDGLRTRVDDPQVESLVDAFISAPVQRKQKLIPNPVGIHQGAPLSSLLCNICLHRLDRWIMDIITPQYHCAYVRYVDDFIILVKEKGHAYRIREMLRHFLLSELKLTLSMEKTHVTHVNMGFHFVGYRFVRERGRTGTWRWKMRIPKHQKTRYQLKLERILVLPEKEAVNEKKSLLAGIKKAYGLKNSDKPVRDIETHMRRQRRPYKGIRGKSAHSPA